MLQAAPNPARQSGYLASADGIAFMFVPFHSNPNAAARFHGLRSNGPSERTLVGLKWSAMRRAFTVRS
jgi:hypothetical protein